MKKILLDQDVTTTALRKMEQFKFLFIDNNKFMLNSQISYKKMLNSKGK